MISLIITTYNRPRLLERLLVSIDRQICDEYEVIIADDNSSDGETSLLSVSFLDTHPGQYFRSSVTDTERPTKVRFSVMINETVGLATGKLLMYLCDDTELLPHAVFCIRNHFNQHPDHISGYVGQVVQDADWVTGERTSPRNDMRNNPGTPIDKAFCVVDHSQVVHTRASFLPWPEHPSHWHHADGMFFDNLISRCGPMYPICDPVNNPMSIYKITDTSVCRQPPEEALDKLRRPYEDRVL